MHRTEPLMITAGCERLGIEVPIIQAPMGGAVGPALASAVSNAGGLGVETRRRMTPGFSTFIRLAFLRFLVAGRGHGRRRS